MIYPEDEYSDDVSDQTTYLYSIESTVYMTKMRPREYDHMICGEHILDAFNLIAPKFAISNSYGDSGWIVGTTVDAFIEEVRYLQMNATADSPRWLTEFSYTEF
jgi:hypothetical protein